MSDEFTVDNQDFVRLATDLGKIPDAAKANVHAAVKQTAQQVQDGWKDRLYSSGHAKWTKSSITYDVIDGIDGVGAEIGPPRGRKQSGIVVLLEYGTPTSPPHGGGAAALEAAEDDFGARLAFAVDAAVRDWP